MSLEDPTMGATFASWTSAAEHGAADKMPVWGVPGETPEEGERFDGKCHVVQHAEQIALRFYHRNTGADLGFSHDGYIPSNAAWAFLRGGVWQRIDTHSAWRLWRAGVQSLNGAPISGETPEEGEWPARDRVPRASSVLTMDQDAAVAVRDSCGLGKLFSETVGERAAVDREFRDALAERTIGLRPAEVTSEMTAAGKVQSDAEPIFGEAEDEHNWFANVYRAMHALAPVPLVSDAEIALTKERNQWRGFSEAQDDLLSLTTRERDEARAQLAELHECINSANLHHAALHDLAAAKITALRAEWDEARANDISIYDIMSDEQRPVTQADVDSMVERVSSIPTLRAELMAAHDRLAKFTTQNAAEPEAPDPIANAIRPRETERWRIGG